MRNPASPSERPCWRFAFASAGSAGTHRGKSKGMLSLPYPNVRGEYLTVKSHDVAFFQSQVTKTITVLVARKGDA